MIIDWNGAGKVDGYDYVIVNKTTVPQTFRYFYEATDFEDTIRNAISIGGDSDTLAATQAQ